MTSTPHVARAAAQFHEAVEDMARVADRRSSQAGGRTPGQSVRQRAVRNVRERGESGINGLDANVMKREWPPGQLMRMVATRLAAHGFEASGEDLEDYDTRRLTIAGLAGMHCRLTIEDCGHTECEYVPQRGWTADAARVAGLVVSMLTDDSSGQRHRIAGQPGISGLPLRTVVGMELVAAGLDVELAVFPDLVDFRVIAELVVAHPDHPERGEVCIGDDGSITMECDCWAGRTSDPGIEEIAESIASDIRNAIAKFKAAVSLIPVPMGRCGRGG